MAKGYWIARIDVHNMDGYKEYVAQNGAVFEKYGAQIPGARRQVRAQGRLVASRNVVLEFKDYETALACYNSPEYAQAGHASSAQPHRSERPRDHRGLRRAAAG